MNVDGFVSTTTNGITVSGPAPVDRTFITCSTMPAAGGTTCDEGAFGTRTSTGLFTILILIIIILGAGGQIFGGYGNYPGYGGFSEYGYTIPRERRGYKYYPYYDYDYDD